MPVSPTNYNFFQEIMHYSGVVCRRTAEFENPIVLALCGSRSPPAPTRTTIPQPRSTRDPQMPRAGITPASCRETGRQKTRLQSHPHISQIADKPRDFLYVRISRYRGGEASRSKTQTECYSTRTKTNHSQYHRQN